MESLINIEGSSPRLSSKACPQCEGVVGLDSPHVRIYKGSIDIFCNEDCLRDAMAQVAPRVEAETSTTSHATTTTSRTKALFVLGLGFVALSPCAALRQAPNPSETMTSLVLERPQRLPAVELELHYGPSPPTKDELADAFAASLGTNGWVHPLPGPSRRMPLRQSRAFGADRPGQRPYECRSGHCGVDLGGELWGEQILSVSDGVIDKVNRNPNRSGGKYVRISHSDRRVFTQYFHLAAIPKRLHKGRVIRAGETIGLLGETGVEHSGAHLHFTVSVRETPEAPDVYIDPEPLIALWPVRRLDQGYALASSTPGIPIGATGRYKRRVRKPATGSPASISKPATGSPASMSKPAAPTLSAPD